MGNELHQAYIAAIDADHAYGAELQRIYGEQAGDARYDDRGTATVQLAQLASLKLASYRAYRSIAFPHAREEARA